MHLKHLAYIRISVFISIFTGSSKCIFFHLCFSVLPAQCPDNCTCYYNFNQLENVTDCSNMHLESLPESIIKFTNWLDMSGNDLGVISGEPKYMAELSYIDFQETNIKYVTDDFIDLVSHSKSLKRIDLSQNKLNMLPKSIQNVRNSSKFLLGGNPFNCECSMLWLRDWLQVTSSVEDKDNVICMDGKAIGTPIHLLDAKTMGCVWPYWVAILAGSVSIISISVIIAAKHNWELIKFCCYMKFDILTNDDEPVDLSKVDFDAFISFW